MARHRLITLAFSHYNEKARWALDRCGISYAEQRYMPGFSQLAVIAATRGKGGRADKVSSRYSTPVFFPAGGEPLYDSTDIALWASKRAPGATEKGPLFPSREVEFLVEHYGVELGPRARRIAYFHAMKAPSVMTDLAQHNVSARQALAFRVLVPLGKQLIIRGLGVTEARATRDVAKVNALLDQVEARLASGSGFLVGDKFTAADLTFACMLAPLLLVSRPDGFGAHMPAIAVLSPEAQDMVNELRARPAGQFALAMFHQHRHESV